MASPLFSSTTRLLRDDKTWTLFYYLVQSIPARNLVRILQERSFFSILPNHLELLVRTARNLADEHAPQEDEFVAPYVEGEPPQKKRKLDLNYTNIDSNDVLPDSQRKTAAMFLACQTISYLVQIGDTQNVNAQTNSETNGCPWLVSVSVAARLLSASLELLLECLDCDLSEIQLSSLLLLIPRLSFLWETCYRLDGSGTKEDQARYFHVDCTFQALTLVLRLKSRSPQLRGTPDAVDSLEKLVSLYSIVPLRSKLSNAKPPDWTSDRVALDEAKAQEANEVVKEYMKDAIPNSQVYQIAPGFLDIAIRSMPRRNSRKRRREQLWLEKLFLGLIRFADPGLPKLELQPDEALRIAFRISEDPSKVSLGIVDRLLDVSMDRKMIISLPVLSYLMSQTILCSEKQALWGTISRLVKSDPDVLIPNSGLKNSEHCLNVICQSIAEGGPESAEHYDIVKTGIIIPLLNGFINARDLLGFIKLWWQGLQDAMYQENLYSGIGESCHLVLAWMDEDVSDAFYDAAKTGGIPSVTAEVFHRALDGLQNLRHKIGSTYDVFADIEILHSLMKSRPQDVSLMKLNTEQLARAILNALEGKSNYQSQRWRLWKLLRLLLSMDSNLQSIEDSFKENIEDLSYASLRTVPERARVEKMSIRAGSLQEALECFHFLIMTMFKRDLNASLKGFLNSEMSHLVELASKHPGPIVSESNQLSSQRWDGRYANLTGENMVVDGCLGILLQYPRSLVYSQEITKSIMSELLHRSSRASRNQAAYGLSQPDLAPVILSLDDLLSSEHVHQQCFDAAIQILTPQSETYRSWAKIIQYASLRGMRRPQLGKLADELMSNLKRQDTNLRDASQSLILLERIVKLSKVSIGKPENWKDIEELIAALPGDSELENLVSYFQVAQCFGRLIPILTSRLSQLDDNRRTDHLLQQILDWCQTSTAYAENFIPGKFSFPVSVGLLENFRRFCDKAPFSSAKDTVKSLRTTAFQNALQTIEGSIEEKPVRIGRLLIVSSVLQNFQDIVREEDDTRRLSELIAKTIDILKTSCSSEALSTDTGPYVEAIKNQLSRILCIRNVQSANQHPPPAIEASLSSTNLSLIQPLSHANLIYLAREVANTLEPVSVEAFPRLLGLMQKQNSLNSPNIVQDMLLAAMLDRLDRSLLKTVPELASQMNLCASLRRTHHVVTFEELCLILELSRTILIRFPGVINQSAVDEMLASISNISSSMFRIANLPLASGSAATVFDRLCGLLGVLLSRFRRRLQARYHLLLPALQNLLRCLYYPGNVAVETGPTQSQQQLQFLQTLPPWLLQSELPLPSTSVVRYTRLLTSICNPAASAVKMTSYPHSTNAAADLNDASKKARSIAGQYMQYLIMEFARNTLNGRIGPENRERLMPGLYAVLDCMPQELMRAMNSAMDPSSRAVFKGLYEDYVRFGKWDQK